MHEIGSIVEGKVTGITKFGAFVELDDGTVGMVHISEVSQTYVNDISEHLKNQQQVKVKVLNITDDGKISLSIKKALPPAPFVRRDNAKPIGGGAPRQGGFSKPAFGSNNSLANSGGAPRSNGAPSRSGAFNRAATTPKGPATFEDMLTKFMSSSEDKISDLKKTSNNRRAHGKRAPKDYD